MIKRSTLILFLALLGPAGLAQANVPVIPPSQLAPSADNERATRLITEFIAHYHYKKVHLDDALSSKILNRYIKALDPNRSYLLASDIQGFQKYRYKMDDYLREAQLKPAYDMFRVFLKRLDQRVAYVETLLKKPHPFNFNINESYQFDRSKAPWAKNTAALDEIWRKRVKNDWLNLKLAGKKSSAIEKTLRERYQSLGRRTHQINSEDVFQLFMNSYMSAIDPHTDYFSPRTSENFEINMSLSLEGIGAVLSNENEYTMVQRIVPGGPADKSQKLHAGDRIIGVGQGLKKPIVNVVGWRLDNVVDLIRGPKGSVVRLQIVPKGAGMEGRPKVIQLTRNKIELKEQAAQKSVIEVPTKYGKLKIGVIDLPTFYMDFAARARGDANYRSTTRDVRKLIGELKKEHVDGIVMDLRENGGGSLTEVTELVGLFIKKGPVVQVKDSSGRLEINQDPEPGVFYKGPLAVLVDHNSASASEIFTGAIKDYHRGIIIGEPTFGKGTVQNLVDLDRFDDGGDGKLGTLKATVAQFFRVNGSSTQDRGVKPDIYLPGAADSEDDGERSLPNALPWASVQPARYTPDKVPAGLYAEVRRQHEARIKHDIAFKALAEELALERKNQEKHSVSLLESKRRAERDATDKKLLFLENEIRTSRGLKPLKDPLGAETETKAADDTPDIELTEAAHILADMINDEREMAPTTLRAADRQNPHNAVSTH